MAHFWGGIRDEFVSEGYLLLIPFDRLPPEADLRQHEQAHVRSTPSRDSGQALREPRRGIPSPAGG